MEYYSAIKKNTFESVLMRWMKLEPIIQGYCYHLSKFHMYALVYCIGVFLSGLLHSVFNFKRTLQKNEYINIFTKWLPRWR